MKNLLFFIFALAIGLLFGRLLGNSGLVDGVSDYPKFYRQLLLVAIIPVLFFVIGIHELGHVVGGLMKDFQFYGLTVGPFSWKPADDGGIKFAWNTNLNVAGGLAMMLPRGTKNIKKRFVWFVAGGPVASVILMIACILLAIVLPANSLGELLSGATAIMSGFIFIVTIIPMQTGGFSSDGKRILTFMGNSVQSDAEVLILQLVAAQKAGTPITDYNYEHLITFAEHSEVSKQLQLSFRHYAYAHNLANNRLDEAEHNLNVILSNLDLFPSGLGESYYLEHSIFLSVFRNDLAGAKAAIAKFKPSPFSEASSTHLGKASIARLEKEYPAMLAEIAKAEKTLDRSMDQSRVSEIRTWFAKWRAEASSK